MGATPGEDDSNLQAHYAKGLEDDRLASGVGLLEFERTKELLLRHLPPPPATVADIGGGPGAYALWLASLGYGVEHRDLVELHVEQLRARLSKNSLVSTAVGDARGLDLADASVDAALLFGPLYHLAVHEERLQSLTELYRVLRPGGLGFVVAISRWAARLDGILLHRVYERSPQVLAEIDEVERTGVLPLLAHGDFVGYLHRPHQVHDELVAAGFEVLSIVAIEGPAGLLADLDQRLHDDHHREVLLSAARALEAVQELLGASPHLFAVGRRPD